MQLLSHPMRLDSAGAAVTIDDSSARAAAELAGHVLSCLRGERSLAPIYGMRDPAMGSVSATAIAGALAICEPEIAATSIALTETAMDRVRVQVDVEWSQQ